MMKMNSMEDIYIRITDIGILSDKFKNKDLVKLTDIISLLEDLTCDIERLEEEIEEKDNRMEEMRKELAVYDPSNYGYPYEWVERGGE